ncbi:MAG: hypothetical protein JF606_03200 [Burkholderiales bacterium]|nr:hypothetical protein [Burkholderiales bacterium]
MAGSTSKNHGIECAATYDTVSLEVEVEVGITSALGRRYFELIHKLDQAMPLLPTLEIEEVISEKQAEQQRCRHKRILLAMSSSARNFSMGVRRRMNEADAKPRDINEKGRKGRRPGAASPSADATVRQQIGCGCTGISVLPFSRSRRHTAGARLASKISGATQFAIDRACCGKP